MKKIFISLFLVCLLLTGCGNYNQNSIIKDLSKKISKGDGYQLAGKLSVNHNDEVYNYDVSVSYQKDDNYKVSLTNESNNHTQIILKNSDGVFVLTPSLNKSFRFQSDWPYNNSQVFLLNALIRDIKNDSKRTFSKKDNSFIFNTKVHYPNNNKLSTQKIVLQKNLKPTKVIVYDNDGVENMSMVFTKVDYSPNFSKEEFEVDSIVNLDENIDKTEKTSSLEDIVYPLFIPSGTKLVEEKKIKKDNGERVIMSYDGEKSFLLVEETVDVFNEFTIIPTSGEPFFLMDTMGVVTDNSLSWESGGIEYYLVSDVMSQEELVEIAQSISGIVSMK